MVVVFPVRGSRQSRAALFLVSKLPNPVMATFPPRFSSDAIMPLDAKKSSATSLALALVRPRRWATAVTSSCLFTGAPCGAVATIGRTNIAARAKRPQDGWSFTATALHLPPSPLQPEKQR